MVDGLNHALGEIDGSCAGLDEASTEVDGASSALRASSEEMSRVAGQIRGAMDAITEQTRDNAVRAAVFAAAAPRRSARRCLRGWSSVTDSRSDLRNSSVASTPSAIANPCIG
jgi:methyl-accepting chemotaxis protein